MIDLTFQSSWVLFLLPMAAAPAVLPYLWKRPNGAGNPAVRGHRAGPREHEIAAASVDSVRPDATASCAGTGNRRRGTAAIGGCARGHPGRRRGHRHSPRCLGEHGRDGLRAAQAGSGKANHRRFHRGSEVRSNRPRGLLARGVHSEPPHAGPPRSGTAAQGHLSRRRNEDRRRDGDWEWDGDRREHAEGLQRREQDRHLDYGTG